MYHKEKPLLLKGSASAINNNLSVQVNLERNIINYAVAHKSVVHLVSATSNGASVNHRQVNCKEPSVTHGSSMVFQAKLLPLQMRTILVITSQKGIQMFEADGSIMLYWYALGDSHHPEAMSCYGKGICHILEHIICVGNHEGQILVFNIPARGTNITLSETLQGHRAAISDLRSEGNLMASADDLGNITVWQAGDKFTMLRRISGFGYPCTSVCLRNDLVIGGYGCGRIRLFNIDTGKICAEVAAHARWITSVDIAKKSGLLLTVGEDTFARVWQVTSEGIPTIEHLHSECVTDLQLQGGRFITEDGRAFGVTGYDSNEIHFYMQS